MSPRAILLVSLSLATGSARAAVPAAPPDPPPGLAHLHRLDRLPAFKESIRVGSVSSYDRTGGNDDGFSGKHSFVRREPGSLVIADLEGPGVVWRIWTPTPTDDPVEFLFDGEEKPRLVVGFRSLFLGKEAPFLPPLVGYGAGGFFSYVPIPFEKSLTIRIRAERVQFYQVNYSIYPKGAALRSYATRTSAGTSAGASGDLERAQALFAARGADLSALAAGEGASVEVGRASGQLLPGKSLVLLETERPGRIVGIRIAPASALAGKDRAILLRIAFDGEERPSVLTPAGDFFGFAWGEPAMESLLVGTKDDVCYAYFPMPFERSARVELLSERESGHPMDVRADVAVAPIPLRPDEGRFYAVWTRESPTEIGKPFTFIRTEGRGHIVGCVLQEQGFESGKTLFFEGDDQTTIDGELVAHGTGSEDFFNGGWYDVPDRWVKRVSFPLSGCLGYDKHLGRTGGYRLFLGDALAYRKSVLLTMEHGGTGNSIPTDNCAVTYLYSERRPSADLAPPPPSSRRVVDLERIVFPAWWQIPILAFPYQNATLERRGERIGEEEVRYLSLRATGGDWFGPPFLWVSCDIPAGGRYAILAEAVRGPAAGRVQLFRDEVPVGDPVDLYAASVAKSGVLKLGELDLVEGSNPIMLKIVSRDERSASLGLDLVHLICEKVQ